MDLAGNDNFLNLLFINILNHLKTYSMKKLIISLTVFMFVAFSVNAQVSHSTSATQAKAPVQKEQKQYAAPVKNDNSNAPDIKFDKTVHDYGTMEQHGDGKCEFVFTNAGKEPLILSNVRSSCGCTVPTWPREPILPGQKGVIKVKYDTKRIGTINKSVYVTSNAKVSPVNLKIKGKILAKTKATAVAPVKAADNAASPVNK